MTRWPASRRWCSWRASTCPAGPSGSRSPRRSTSWSTSSGSATAAGAWPTSPRCWAWRATSSPCRTCSSGTTGPRRRIVPTGIRPTFTSAGSRSRHHAADEGVRAMKLALHRGAVLRRPGGARSAWRCPGQRVKRARLGIEREPFSLSASVDDLPRASRQAQRPRPRPEPGRHRHGARDVRAAGRSSAHWSHWRSSVCFSGRCSPSSASSCPSASSPAWWCGPRAQAPGGVRGAASRRPPIAHLGPAIRVQPPAGARRTGRRRPRSRLAAEFDRMLAETAWAGPGDGHAVDCAAHGVG